MDTIRKATELKSLNELSLSAKTRNYIKRRGLSIDDIIWESRVAAFNRRADDPVSKWKLETMSALEEAGFIRPTKDFTMTFAMNRLYNALLPSGFNIITKFSELSNSKYEDFRSLSNEEIENVKATLSDILTEREFEIICQRFGLDGEGPKPLETVGRHFNINRERIRQIEMKAMRKLKRCINKLPKIIDAPDDMNQAAHKLGNELAELYKRPEVMRAHSIEAELKHLQEFPFRYNCKYLSSGSTDQRRIDELELSVRTYNCLKRAGINTIADTVNLPKDGWLKVRFLNRKGLEEVIEKMHLFGYRDFNVEIPPTLCRW